MVFSLIESVLHPGPSIKKHAFSLMRRLHRGFLFRVWWFCGGNLLIEHNYQASLSPRLDFWPGLVVLNTTPSIFGEFRFIFGVSEEFWTWNSLYWVCSASNSFWHAIKTWSWFKFKRYLQASSTVEKRVFILQIKQWKIIGPNFWQKFLLVWIAPKFLVCMFTFCLCSSNVSSLFLWHINDNKFIYSRLDHGQPSDQWGSRFQCCGIWASTRVKWWWCCSKVRGEVGALAILLIYALAWGPIQV